MGQGSPRLAGRANDRLGCSAISELRDYGPWPGTRKGPPDRSFVTIGSTCRKDPFAEGVGFEPTVPTGHNGFRDRPIRPLSHPSGRQRAY